MSIYIDVGYYAGRAKELLAIDDSWKIYAFEPNPEIKVPDFVQRKAAWTEEGKHKFSLNWRDDAGSLNEAGELEVETFDFSKFVSELPEDLIVCSFDAEGAEFPILEKMLNEGTIGKINFLDIEFHHRLIMDKSADDSRELIAKLQNLGVIVRLKDFIE